GRVVKTEIPQEKVDGRIRYQITTAEYDTAGRVSALVEKIDSDRTTRTEYTYDKRGNLTMVKSCLEDGKESGDSSAQYVQYVYDNEGNKVRQYTGMTSPLTLTVSEITNVEDGKNTFSYAGKNYQIEISDKKKSDTICETKYEYSSNNELVSCTDPEGRTEIYVYDVNGNLIKTVDKNGNTLKNTYDYQNRLIKAVAKEKKTGKETTHTYSYNAYGEVATQDETTFSYGDVSGQITKETTKLTKSKDIVKNYAYDSAGNKSSFGVQIGEDTKLSLTYDYDGESKLTSVTDGNGNEVVNYDYDLEGNLASRTVAGANLTSTNTYNYQNQLTTMVNVTEKAGVISEYNSQYLLNGQKEKENSTIQDVEGKNSTKIATYTYDLLGRVTKETKTGAEDISYTYDNHNNRKEMKIGNKVIAYRYNKNDELLRTDTLNTDTEENDVVIYKNDNNGNQLATVNRYNIPNVSKADSYIDVDVTLGDNRLNENVVNHYDAFDQLTKTLTKNYKVSFTYDAEGLRTSKTVNSEKTVFVWDGDQLVMELSKGGEVKKRYVRGNDLVYADKGEGTEKQFYVTNSHGDVVQLLDETGSVAKTYEYDSFGNEVNPEKEDENPFRYCGEYYDKETEEIYLRARYYQPAVGRFLTRDTYTGENDDPLSLHLYTYCENDGVNYVDPSGNISIKNLWNKAKRTVKKGIRTVVNRARESDFGKAFTEATISGKNEKLMNLLHFYEEDGSYHTYYLCWQSKFGYNKSYDFVFNAATGAVPKRFKLTTKKYRFNLKKVYVLWAWKGDYLNLGAGGEMGIYSTHLDVHSKAEMLKPIYSSLKIKRRGVQIIKWKPNHLEWWITGFKPQEETAKAKELAITCEVRFTRGTKDVMHAFIDKYQRDNDFSKYWKVKAKRATMKW
nr:DUF4474 domain-containing protein [Eubacterium sp.]